VTLKWGKKRGQHRKKNVLGGNGADSKRLRKGGFEKRGDKTGVLCVGGKRGTHDQRRVHRRGSRDLIKKKLGKRKSVGVTVLFLEVKRAR